VYALLSHFWPFYLHLVAYYQDLDVKNKCQNKKMQGFLSGQNGLPPNKAKFSRLDESTQPARPQSQLPKQHCSQNKSTDEPWNCTLMCVFLCCFATMYKWHFLPACMQRETFAAFCCNFVCTQVCEDSPFRQASETKSGIKDGELGVLLDSVL